MKVIYGLLTNLSYISFMPNEPYKSASDLIAMMEEELARAENKLEEVMVHLSRAGRYQEQALTLKADMLIAKKMNEQEQEQERNKASAS